MMLMMMLVMVVMNGKEYHLDQSHHITMQPPKLPKCVQKMIKISVKFPDRSI